MPNWVMRDWGGVVNQISETTKTAQGGNSGGYGDEAFGNEIMLNTNKQIGS